MSGTSRPTLTYSSASGLLYLVRSGTTDLPYYYTPQIVGQGNTMINFGIYRGGDIDPNGVLNNKYLVKNTATFTFTGVSGYTEAHIVDKVVFGLGTSPDSTLTVALPEPAGCGLLAAAAAVLAARRARRRTVPTRRPTWPSHGQPSSEGRSSSWLGFPRRCGFASSWRRNTATTSSIGTT